MAFEQHKPIEIQDVTALTDRNRRNITNDLVNLPTAIAEQNLEKYGYKIGGYFEGPSGYRYNLADMKIAYTETLREKIRDLENKLAM